MGPWSTSTASFALAGAGPLQELSYSYDAVGNITQLVDASSQGKTVDYTYDDLSRLTAASSSNAVGGDYNRTYTYDAIGNITASDLGSYTYSGTGFTNPHAVTSINGQTYSYDNAGNLTSDGTRTNEWDYRNQLLTTVVASTTHRYGYDHTGSRTTYFNGVATTTYASRFYDVSGTTATKHLFAGDTLVATIETANGTTSTYTVHTDDLGGTSVVSDGEGTVVQTLDYYPFGSLRTDEHTGFSESRKFIGQEYDDDSQLSYLNARYYAGARGQFISQDLEFWIASQDWLFDPQNQNAYAYARNDPITLSDPTGRSAVGEWESEYQWYHEFSTVISRIHQSSGG